MHVLIVSSVIASLLAFHNAINRYTLSLTEEGLLPPVLGRIHPRTARRTSRAPRRPPWAPGSHWPAPTRTRNCCSG
ncbi:hypothetical protein GCM10010295_36020 [Streptomyces intermedius]